MRSLILLIDSFGAGPMPDAEHYGDQGANTLLHICQAVRGEKWPALKSLGLGNVEALLDLEVPGLDAVESPRANYGLMKEASPGKDTTTGHWELMGLPLEAPFHQFAKEYPSFPDDLVEAFLRESGYKGILGNRAASGTEIIKELGEEHEKTGFPICYTSADSVFQIAAHVNTIPLERLYELCEIARRLCDPLKVGRVIARPFEGKPGDYSRTADRRDYSLALPGPSLFDHCRKAGIETVAVGKTGSIFNEQGFDQSHHDKGNHDCLKRTMALLKEKPAGDQLIFVNLVDTDMLYGHRRDPEGYYEAVDQIDSQLDTMIDLLEEGDNLIITADHGCDPCFRGSDHTREMVPLLFYRHGMENGRSIGVRNSFADLAASLAELHGLKETIPGESFLGRLGVCRT